MTIGQRLRAAREANEMTIGDIARRTYIQPKFIQAIDEDNFAMIPDSHRRLFVREYAKLVGINPEELLTLLPEHEPPPSALPQEPDETSSRGSSRGWRRSRGESEQTPLSPPVPSLPENDRKAYSEVLRRLSSGGGVKLGSSNSTMWLIGGAVALLIIVAVYYIFFSGSVIQQSAGDGTVADTATGSPTEILTRDTGDSAAQQPGTTVSDDSLTLEGKASGKVWFAIVMDGKRSETGTLDSGGTKVWRAAETFKLSLGNAGGLALSLNDRAIGTLGPVKTSVRNQIIDANGVRKTGPARRVSTTSSARRTQRQTAPPRVITPTELRRAQPSR